MRLVQIGRISNGQSNGACPGAAHAASPLRDPSNRTIRYVRISLTDHCNYRCTYCMPDEGAEYGARSDVLSFDELERLVRALTLFGIADFRLTGGEPTIRRDLVDLVGRLSAIHSISGDPIRLSMTTNGEALESLALPLFQAGLGRLTVSLDTLDVRRFREITRRGDLERVVRGLDAARNAGFSPIKLNVVAIRGFNDAEIGSLCRFAWDRGIVPRFIELMPMADGRLFAPGESMSAADVRRALVEELGAELAPDEGEGIAGLGPARYWRVTSGAYAQRRLGTIAAMTENFCSGCNRIRISATGQIHACLANDAVQDLRRALRAGDDPGVESALRAALGEKREGHFFESNGRGGPRKPMISIGG
jgi:cyclic pyranopterin phosphate synthase